jgi:microbial collagenase
MILLAGLLTAGCYKNEPVPAAAFSYIADTAFTVPCNVQFINQSTNAFSWHWSFGDDSTSADTNPLHIYMKAGIFPVELRAYTESRKEWASCRAVLTIRDSVSRTAPGCP